MASTVVFTDRQLTTMIETMRSQRITPSRLSQILESGIFAAICDLNANLEDVNAVRVALKLDLAASESFIVVDYRQSLEQMLTALRLSPDSGSYYNKIIRLCEMTGEGIVKFEFKLFRFGQSVPSSLIEKAIREDNRTNPWEPARIEHLLTFGARYPRQELRYPIVALGSIIKDPTWVSANGGKKNAPYLQEVKGNYYSLNMRSLAGPRWSNEWRFMAVRKTSSS
jgi:hypothetical protein